MTREEAMERIKAWNLDEDDMEVLSAAIPELTAETDDENERIRKDIIALIKFGLTEGSAVSPGSHTTREEALAYLEKRKFTEWSEFDKSVLEDAICATDLLGNDKSFTKYNPNLAKAFRVAKDWLKDLPERFNPQSKQEWSEEEKKIISNIRHLIFQHAFESGDVDVNGDYCKDIYQKADDFLKSLYVERLKSFRPQITDSKPLYTVEQVDEKIREVREWSKEEPKYYQYFDPDC